VPQLDRIQSKPELDKIVKMVLAEFGHPDRSWPVGSRADDVSRAMAAYLARRRCGYSATAIAGRLGYAHPSSVSHALRRIESGPAALGRIVKRLERKLRLN